MASKLSRWLLSIGLVGLAGCGSNVTYFKIALSAFSDPAGNACPPSGSVITTFTGIDGQGTMAIYTLPPLNGTPQYLLDTGSIGLTGTLASGKYTFTGNELDDAKGNTIEVKTTTTITITLTTSGPGLTGTMDENVSCSSSGTQGCSFQGGTDGSAYACDQTATVLATQISGPTEVAGQQPTSPTGPTGQASGN